MKVGTDGLLNERMVYNTKLAKVLVAIDALEVVTVHLKGFVDNLLEFLVVEEQLLKVLCGDVAFLLEVFY